MESGEKYCEIIVGRVGKYWNVSIKEKNIKADIPNLSCLYPLINFMSCIQIQLCK